MATGFRSRHRCMNRPLIDPWAEMAKLSTVIDKATIVKLSIRRLPLSYR